MRQYANAPTTFSTKMDIGISTMAIPDLPDQVEK
jgi:hypothetical protein